MTDILVIRLSSLGDIVLTLPALHALRAANPRCRLSIVVERRYASLFAEDPVVDEIIPVPRERRASRQAMAARRPDLVIDLQGTGRSRALVGAIRARRRVTVKRDRFFRWRLVARARWGHGAGAGVAPGARAEGVAEAAGPAAGGHETPPVVASRFLEAVGVSDPGRRGEILRTARLTLSGATRERAAAWVRSHSGANPPTGWIAVMPGASHPVKAWPAERFAELIRRLGEGASGMPPTGVLLLGGDADRPLVEALARSVDGGVIAWTGDQELPFLAALIEHAGLALANDSGLAHLAAALAVPVVGIFGPTVTAFGFPPGSPGSRVIDRPLPCRPCSLHGNRECRLGTHACMRGVEIGSVLANLCAARQFAGTVNRP